MKRIQGAYDIRSEEKRKQEYLFGSKKNDRLADGRASGLDLFCKICGDAIFTDKYSTESGLCRSCRSEAKAAAGREEYRKRRLEAVKHDVVSVLKRRISGALSADLKRIKLLENRRLKSHITTSTEKLTMGYLLNLYLEQRGLCALTGRALSLGPLKLPSGGIDKDVLSLDRIDPTLPHIKGNVRFVTYFANIAKREFNDSEFMSLCWNVVCHLIGQRGDDRTRNLVRDILKSSDMPKADDLRALVELATDFLPRIDVPQTDRVKQSAVLNNAPD